MSEYKLVLVRGLPGSGKSTYARSLTGFEVAADDFMVDATGNYAFDPARLRECHEKCQARVKDWMNRFYAQRPKIIAVHNTFVQRWEMAAYYELAKQFGYDVEEVVMTTMYGNTHGVPETTIDAMRARWEA
jgi:predicted kinase